MNPNYSYQTSLEVWKDVRGYEGYYQVSNLGRVKSLERVFVKEIKPESILKPSTSSNGYTCVMLCVKGKPNRKYIHRLLAQAFIPNIHNKPCINHINGIKYDNSIENIEWCTKRENALHAIRVLKKDVVKGSNNGMAKLNEFKVCVIRSLLKDGISCKEISKNFNVTSQTIFYIKNGVSWKHVG